MNSKSKFGNHLVTFRRKNGWTQEVLADKLGIKREQVSRYERGDSDILLTTLLNWAELLNIDIVKLIPKG